MIEDEHAVTQLLRAMQSEHGHSPEQLLPLVYDELRRLAAWRMAHEPPGQTLQATALVHEAWLRLTRAAPQHWDNRVHFFSAAAEAMRRILVENARRKHRLKRGGDWLRVEADALEVAGPSPDDMVLRIDAALEELARVSPVEAEVVKLHHFAGLKHDEIAQLLHLSERTVKRYWNYAKVWLYQRIRE